MRRNDANRLIRLDPRHGPGLAIAIKNGDALAALIAHDDFLPERGQNVDPVLVVGKCYFIKTVSDYYVGKLVNQTHDWLVLEDASWIPDTGRFHEFLRTGRPAECEPMAHGAIVNIGAITAVCVWPFAPLTDVI